MEELVHIGTRKFSLPVDGFNSVGKNLNKLFVQRARGRKTAHLHQIIR